MRPGWGFLSSQTWSSGLNCLSGDPKSVGLLLLPTGERGKGEGGSSKNRESLQGAPNSGKKSNNGQGNREAHCFQPKRQTGRRPRALQKGISNTPGDRHHQSSGVEATLSKGWAPLSPRPFKGQDWGKTKRPKESERKLKSRHGHMFAEHLLCAGPGVWPWGGRPTHILSTPPGSEQLCSTGLPLAVGTRGSSGSKRLYKDPRFNCFMLKKDGLSLSCADFVFSSFP